MSKLTAWPLSPPQTARLLRHWNVGVFVFSRPGPGTASPAVVVTTRRGQYFLKQRAPQYAARPRLSYDHAVMRHLKRAGLPITLSLKTAVGSRWVTEGEHVYEVYPWVEGERFDPENQAQLAAAGTLLGRLHQATAEFTPAGEKALPRLFDPRDRLAEIAEARGLLAEGVNPGASSPEQAAATLDFLEETVRGILERVPEERYWALPQAVVHGDYHFANLLFAGDEVAGVFDFDWCSRQARLKDVVDGLMFFASRREPTGGGDLAALTAVPLPDAERTATFLAAYEALAPLTAEERLCLPDLWRERWLYVRLDAMSRKLPRALKLRFLLPGVEEPLRNVPDLGEARP
ncbi:MAG TPA: phosphotransferase [Armatimonadota bacterium]|jgi:Ser/Thr protein kinase RdoA (MazF antagonist)